MNDDNKNLCRSAAHAIELLQGKWKMRILCAIRYGPVRLGQLGRAIPTASKKVLTDNLRDLESRGIVVRRDLSGTVRHLEYDFSEAMRAGMTSILDHLAALGHSHLVRVRDGNKDHES